MTRITTGFGFATTACEILDGVNLGGKRMIVTGGGAGIGLETARALADAGASVTLAVRRPEAAREAAHRISLGSGNPVVDVRPLDLSDLRSVAAFTESWEGPLHCLINNAGVMALPDLQRSAQGHEMQFATNYLGHFVLAVGLRKALASAYGARIASLSSSGHHFCPFLFDDPGFDFVPYTPIGAYGQSKTATALLAVAITRHWADDAITCNSLHPGAIATGLQKHTGGLKTPAERQKTVAQGAATSVLVAASPLIEGIGGRYFEDCNEAETIWRRPDDFSGGVAPYALDPENAERLWAYSHHITGTSA
jgi:NAD(P)-dependent dehydrogenase (short-subunit alcohol dehydrogenase family)